MADVIKEGWPRVATYVVTGLALAFFISITAPNITWINTDADGTIYQAAAKYLIPSHPTGAPLFNLFNAFWIRAFPFGSEAWRLALVSAVTAGITAGVLYHYTRSLIAPLVFVASGVVASQASIIETYAPVTLCMVIMYVYRDRPRIVVAAAFVGLGVHHLIGLTLIPIVIWYWRSHRPLKPFVVLALAPLMYAYIPLTYFPGSVWMRGNGVKDIIDYFGGQSGLILGLGVLSRDALIRASDATFILGAGFAAATIPIILRFRNDLLTWLFILPILHYLLGLPHVTYIYTFPAFAFGGIMAAQWLRERPKQFAVVVAAFAVVMVGINSQVFDIGEGLDPGLSGTAFYIDLNGLPTQSVVYTYNRGWELTTVLLFNLDKETDIGIIPVRRDELETIRKQILQAYSGGKLYHTQVINSQDYSVEIVAVSPVRIWRDIVKQNLWPRFPTDEELIFPWGNRVNGGNRAGSEPTGVAVDNGSVGADPVAYPDS